jgi:hypothetical protein
MKKIILFLTILVTTTMLYAQEKWNDNNVVYGTGNGKMIVYGNKANITKIYSSPYSTPSFYTVNITAEKPFEVVSNRENGTAIWTHQIIIEGKKEAIIKEFVNSENPVFVRSIETSIPLKLKISFNLQATLIENSKRYKKASALMMYTKPGASIYQSHVYPRIMYSQIILKGNIQFAKAGDDNERTIDIAPGKSEFYIVGGPEYNQVIENSEYAINSDIDKMKRETRKSWLAFIKSGIDFEKELPANIPMRNKLLQTIDDVAVMIKVQQSIDGASMAGYPYPLGYVRDQYGVSRGLLAMGYSKEAKEILKFYWEKFKRNGAIYNAQGIGISGVFHIHENDEVEITGYLIMQAFDLYEKTNDAEFVNKLFPMLEWAWEAQKKNLVGGMLPFNGDETYVAGGIIPRSTLNDGSAESTMLFIESGEKLLMWIEKNKLWSREKIKSNSKILNEVKNKYVKNFWKDGKLITNNPERTKLAEMPQYRHGVCEGFLDNEGCILNRTHGIGWIEKNKNGRYLCIHCQSYNEYPKAEEKIYELISVSLTPFYFDSHLLDKPKLKSIIELVSGNYLKSGRLPSMQNTSKNEYQQRSVGYDYGLLLYALTKVNSPAAEKIFMQTLDVVDEVGTWSEYYLDHHPQGTRYRPWESSINIEALIAFATKKQ